MTDTVVDSISIGMKVVDTEVMESVNECVPDMEQVAQARRRSTGLGGGAQVCRTRAPK